MKIQVDVFWVVAFQPEDVNSKILRNVGILPQHYTASQPRRPRLELNNMAAARNPHLAFSLMA